LQQNGSPGESAAYPVALPRDPASFPGYLDTRGDNEEHVRERIDILVDGSGDGHSVALFPNEEVYFSYERGASNNETEFNAVILALHELPGQAHARIRTDSQVVVWHLAGDEKARQSTFLRKKVLIQDLIVEKSLKVEIQWIPRRQNRADRYLRHYIASLAGARGEEPLHRRVRRLESENTQLRARLRRAMAMLERRSAFSPDAAIPAGLLQEENR